MFERGLAYHTISVTKSVLSGVLHIPGVTAISEHLIVVRLLKGIFHVRPPQPSYELIWDTDLVISSEKPEFFKIQSKIPFPENCYPVNIII